MSLDLVLLIVSFACFRGGERAIVRQSAISGARLLGADATHMRGLRLAVVLLALSSTGCASALVAAEGAIHRSIAVTQDTANAVCDAKIVDAEKCRTFNVQLIPVIVSAKSFNRAVRENSAAEVPAMLAALVGMRDAALAFFPPDMAVAIRARIESAWTLVSGVK